MTSSPDTLNATVLTGKKKIVVLISGNGSNLQALIDAVTEGRVDAVITLVVSNKSTAYGLQRATKAGIPTLTLTMAAYKAGGGVSRVGYDQELARRIGAVAGPHDLQVLAGWMHILSPEYLTNFPLVINLHPALPGAFVP